MKIIIVGSAHPLRGGGIATFNERLATALQDQGHDVCIYSFSLQYPNFLFPGKNQFTDEPAPHNLKIKSVINSINPLNWVKVGNQLKAEQADLIIVRYWLPFMGPSLGTILRIAKQNKRTKVIAITDNIIPHEARIGDKQLTQYFLAPIDGCISMSEEVLKDLKTIAPQKPATFAAHPMYDNYGAALTKTAATQGLQLDPKGKYLLFFGFIRQYKGLDILLDAMADPRIKAANIKLIVAGEYYGDPKPYEEQIARLGIQDQLCMFTDFIPNDDVKIYFSASDCVVQPYRTATQSGISQVAYHFDKPMIVTNVGGLPEIVPNGKVGYVTPVDSQAIADAIIQFYQQDPNIFKEGIANEKHKYTWDTFIVKTMQLFRQL